MSKMELFIKRITKLKIQAKLQRGGSRAPRQRAFLNNLSNLYEAKTQEGQVNISSGRHENIRITMSFSDAKLR